MNSTAGLRIGARLRAHPPSTVAFAGTVAFLLWHEVLYHLTGGDDFPVKLLVVNDAAWIPISHGGLDSIGVGLLIVFLLLWRERGRP